MFRGGSVLVCFNGSSSGGSALFLYHDSQVLVYCGGFMPVLYPGGFVLTYHSDSALLQWRFCFDI